MKSTYLIALLTLAVVGSPAMAIKKCKDANGKVHYGDTAIEECANTKVTTLTERGFVKEHDLPPKSRSEMELEAEQAAKAAEAKRAEREAEDERLRILSIYETPEDIDRQRDNQVRSVQSNIDVHESYLANMEKRVARYAEQKAAAKTPFGVQTLEDKISSARQRMKEYSLQLESLEKQKKDIYARFEKERELYLALKQEAQ